jgi:hypothetical protein
MSIGLLWPMVALSALIVTQVVKKLVKPKYWQTRTGTKVLRLVPVAFGSLACALLGQAGVSGAGDVDVDALLGGGMGATAVAAFHLDKAARSRRGK